MALPRFARSVKAATLVPLAALSLAATAAVAGVGATTIAATSEAPDLPDGTAVPEAAIQAPASVSDDFQLKGLGDSSTVAQTANPSGIPAAALAAYQRAEVIINDADASCKIPWQLIAAIGRVESDHGRHGGNRLNSEGVSTPGLYGPALNGKKDTVAVSDTDGGEYDNDQMWDRAVGPMQFVPSTWSVVGVDADGDGKRNPQDIDDASLATAIYLCSGDDNLSTDAGQRKAVYRYNNSNNYVDLVVKIMKAYMVGDFSTVPDSTTSAGYLVPRDNTPSASPLNLKDPKANQGSNGNTGGSTGASNGGDTGSTGSTGGSTGGDTGGSNGGDTGNTGGNSSGGNGGGDKGNGGKGPVSNLVKEPEKVVKDPVEVVEDTLTWAEARVRCLVEQPLNLTGCIEDLLNNL